MAFSTHYLLARGRGEPVILLHGRGSTSYMWRYVMPRLVEEGYTVLAPDLRGFGDTEKAGHRLRQGHGRE